MLTQVNTGLTGGRKMIDKMVFARSFSRKEQKILTCGAFIGCFIIAFTLSTIFKPYLAPLPIYFDGETMKPIIFNFSNSRSDIYELNGDVRIHGTSSTIFIASTQHQDNINSTTSWTIKPYARKEDTLAMGRVTTFKIKYETPQKIPSCNQIFTIPSVVFSTGGYAGNPFHAFTDVLVPLYVTSHRFDRDVVFLFTNNYSKWTSKYKIVLDKLSKYDILDIDKENQVLCFSRVVIGLKANKEFTIDQLYDEYARDNYSMTNFTKLLRSAYSLQRESVKNDKLRRPRMLIICRRRARRLVNKHVVSDMARTLGFDVMKKMVWNVSLVAKLVNSFDVMVGVHGAGLTNMVFLPENAVVIQIVPFGLGYIAKTCFKIPAEDMKLRYLEYKVNLNESSLSLPDDNKMYRDPVAMSKKGFDDFRSVYLDNQDINLDLVRFRKTLLKALEILLV